MSYDAFISYSHAADSQLAPRLQDGLQRMAKPWWRRRALHVFRDDTGLTANPGLWSSIEEALDDSDWFVFLASEEAAKSTWVERELGHWLERHGSDRILPVVTGGSWVWDTSRNDFDMSESTAVPAVLSGVFSEEPRHVDLTWARSTEQVDLRNAQFRDQVAEIAAPLHGMAKDDLVGVDIREHRRTLRWVWGAAAALLLLTVLSVFSGFLATRSAREAALQRDEASVQRVAAERSAKLANSERSRAETAQGKAEDSADKARKSDEASRKARAIADALAITAEQERDTASAARDKESAARASEEVARELADANAVEAKRNAVEAERNARVAAENEARANDKAIEAAASAELAKRNAAEARQQRNAAIASEQAANASEQAALASQRQTQRALESETQARAAEEAARGAAERSANDARAAQSAAEASQRSEAVARRAAETEALASASAASNGSLSLLLGVEAARDRSAPAARAAVPTAAGSNSALARSGTTAAKVTAGSSDSTAGRRALFQAVTAAQGGIGAYRVDRFLPFPAEMVDAPVLLWKPSVSPDGRYLAATELPDSYRGLRGPTPTRVFIWDLQSDTPAVKVLAGHRETVTDLAFGGNGSTLATQDSPFAPTTKAVTRVWDVRTGTQLLEREATLFVDPTARFFALQESVQGPDGLAGQVEFVDGATGLVTARQDGVVAADFHAIGKLGETRGTSYINSPFSRDGRYAYGNSAGKAVLWDLDTGGRLSIPLFSLTAATSSTPRVSPDGSGIVAVVENGTDLGILNSADGSSLMSAPVTGRTIVSMTWNPTGTRLAVLDSGGTLVVIDLDLDATNNTWVGSVPVGEISFDRSGRFVVSISEIPTNSGPVLMTILLNLTTGADVGVYDGALLTTRAAGAADMFMVRNDQTLVVMDSAGGRTRYSNPGGVTVQSAILSNDGTRLAIADSSGVNVWNLVGNPAPVATAASPGHTLGIAFGPDGSRLAGVGLGGDPVIWDLNRIGAGTQIGIVKHGAIILDDGVTTVEPSAGGTSVIFRDLITDETRPGPTLLPGESVDYILTGPGGGPLVINLTNGTALVSSATGSVIGRVDGTVATVSRDGARLAVRAGGRSVNIVNAADLTVVTNISLDALPDDDLPNIADVITLNPDGSMLAASNATGDVTVWNSDDGRVITQIDGASADRISFPLWGLAFSPDSSRLVVNTPSNTVRMYETSTQSTWNLLATEVLPSEYAGRVVFNPDGTLIAIDGLFLLDGATLRPIATLLAGPGSVTRFTSDGRRLVTIRADESENMDEALEVVTWTVSIDDLTVEACRMAGRDMTIDEWNRHMGGSGLPYRRSCG